MSTASSDLVHSPTMTDAASAYLDALRAIGANLVIASHVLALYFGIKQYPFGSLGVTIFFLLSGYLIMQSMLNRSARPGPHLPGFLADRTARILTPYIPALIVIALTNLVLVESTRNGSGLSEGFVAFVGNLLLLQDHSAFQFLELAGMDLPWRIRPYNTAEPFWTVAIEMWIYVCVGLFFFCVIKREQIDRRYLIALVAIGFPVVIWNAAAGGGKSLTLIWLLGAVAGLLFHLWRANAYANARAIAGIAVAFGTIALIGRSGKVGFRPYDLQTAALLAIVMFGVLAYLFRIETFSSAWRRWLGFIASYSYSLYLLHNTVLIVVLEAMPIADMRLRAALAVVLAHVCSYVLYLGFERHYRSVASWFRPRFERLLLGRKRELKGDQTNAAPQSAVASLAMRDQ